MHTVKIPADKMPGVRMLIRHARNALTQVLDWLTML